MNGNKLHAFHVVFLMFFYLGVGIASSADVAPPSSSPDAKYLKTRRLYRGSEGERHDEKSALKLLEEAVEEGSLEAQALLVYHYLNQISTVKTEDFAVARTFALVPGGKGIALANYVLGKLYIEGLGVEKDADRAQEYFKKAVKGFEQDVADGDSLAMLLLALCLDRGVGAQRDQAKTFGLLQKAAELGDPSGMEFLGNCYRLGLGVEKDEAKAVEWYRKAAELGESDAMILLGRCHSEGVGVEKDEAKAAELYQKSVNLGSLDAAGLLGLCYLNGSGVKKNAAKAFELFKNSFELDVKREDIFLPMALALCYAFGAGVEKNDEKAFELTREAEKRGFEDATCWLGEIYERGGEEFAETEFECEEHEGFKEYASKLSKDETKAFKWRQRAAELGAARAMRKLVDLYKTGVGVEKSGRKAFEWLQKLAELDPSAAVELGAYYKTAHITKTG